MPETSRKLEYTADISVRSEGLTAIMKGKAPQASSNTKKKVPTSKLATVAQGQCARPAAAR